MANLIIYRGLPGCGKTASALEEIRCHPRGTMCKISRDDHRRHVFATHYRPESDDFEDLVTVLQFAAIRAALNQGVDVLCDDTNLYPEHTARLMHLALDCGAKWYIRDLTHVPLEVCTERDALRPLEYRVGAKTIRAMYDRHCVDGWAPMPIPALDTEEAV